MATIPSSGKDRDWVAVLRRTMASAWWGHDVSGIDQAPVVLNGESLLGVNAAGTGTIPLIGVDGDRVVVAGESVSQSYKTVVFRSQAVGTQSGRRFWISDGNYTIVGVREVHSVAEVTAATMTAGIQKVPSGGSAQSLLASGLNMKSVANTPQNGVLISNPSVVSLQTGDSLVWTTSPAGTELAGVVLEVLMSPAGRNSQVSYYFANPQAFDGPIFIANRATVITRIDYVHGTPSSGACNMQVTLDTGTTAPGAGTDILSNNSGAGFDCAATAGVVQNGVLVAAATRMAAGDRLSVDFAGTTTPLTLGVLTITFSPTDGLRDVVWHAVIAAAIGDGQMFIADRNYEIVAASAVWGVAAVAGANCQLTVESGTQAPGAGLDLLSNDTNAGWQIDGTANTVEVGTFISTARNVLLTGDRLGLDFTAVTNLTNMVVSVTLKAV